LFIALILGACFLSCSILGGVQSACANRLRGLILSFALREVEVPSGREPTFLLAAIVSVVRKPVELLSDTGWPNDGAELAGRHRFL
jgi:hypothetical protein